MQDGPRYLTDTDIQILTLLNPSNVPANQPVAMHVAYGSIGQTEDGRIFRYVKFPGTTTIQPGLLLVAPAAPTNSTGLAIAATSAQPNNSAIGSGATGGNALASGSTSFVVTNGSTAVTKDQFGFVEILVAAGGTYCLKLRGNSAAGNGAAVTLYLDNFNPLPPNMTTLIPGTDTVNLRLSNWNQPVASATKAAPVGVTVVSVPQSATASYAGWVQTGGRTFAQVTSATLGGAATQDIATNAGFLANNAASTTTNIGSFVTSAASSTATVNLSIPV